MTVYFSDGFLTDGYGDSVIGGEITLEEAEEYCNENGYKLVNEEDE